MYSKGAFFGMGGVCCALFKITVWECAHVGIVYVWFLKHTFTSMTFPQDDNLDAGGHTEKRGETDLFEKQLLVRLVKSTTSNSRRM